MGNRQSLAFACVKGNSAGFITSRAPIAHVFAHFLSTNQPAQTMHTPDQWKRIKSLFERATELPESDRAGFLSDAAPNEPAIRAAVQELLAASSQTAQFLEKPVLPNVVTEGQHIGPYRLLRLLGRGGMGQVFLAAREDGTFARQVALKLLRPGLSTPDFLHRLQNERQILANLRHPNIAHVYDGGSTPWGDPYFTMEYVEGLPITTYCEQHQLGLAKRLRLFQTVCETVHYAHQNLVVHRDLKPSNILVTIDGTVKLLDFGIAKMLRPDGDAAEPQTSTHVMTPEYAAPEQICGDAITTAADVYALGILLYELLTGTRPYELRERALQEVVRIISEEEPAKPSDRATSSETSLTASWRRTLRGDLDNVVMMALQKETKRRYASAEALAQDVTRFLKGEPIMARPQTAGYVVRKFVLRHKVGMGITWGVCLLAMTFAFWHDVQITAERNHALEEAARATAVQNLLVGLFEKADPAQARGLNLSVREILDMGARVADQELSGQPQVKAEILRVLGDVYSALGEDETAGAFLAQAQTLLSQTIRPPHAAFARVLMQRGEWFQNQGDYARADSFFRQASAMYNALPEQHEAEKADLWHMQAYLAHDEGHMQDAETFYQKALNMRRKLYPHQHPKIALSLNDYGGYLMNVGRYEEARHYMEDALAIRRAVYGQQPHPDLAESLYNIGYWYYEMGESDKSLPYYRETLAIEEKLYDPNHVEIATTLNNLGGSLASLDRFDEAEQILQRALNIQLKDLSPDHPNIAVTRRNLGFSLMGKGNYPRAEQELRMAVASRSTGESHYRGVDETLLAKILMAQRKSPEARERLSIAQRLIEKELPADHYRRGEVLSVWAEWHLAQRETETAIAYARKSIQILTQHAAQNQIYLAQAKMILTRALIQSHQFSEAETVLRDLESWVSGRNLPQRSAQIREIRASLQRSTEKA